jgi:hypothetical protein
MAVHRNRIYPAGGSSPLTKQPSGTPPTTNATSPPRGFSWGAQMQPPEVSPTGSVTSPGPGHSGLSGPIPLGPNGKPAAVDVPHNGAQQNDGLNLQKYSANQGSN